MTRRKLLLTATVASLCAAKSQQSSLAVEGYIFQQYAERVKKPLQDVVGQVIPMARAAGFTNIELSPAFLKPDMRDHVFDLVRSEKLMMPSLYVGGPLHNKAGAEQTIAAALEAGHLCTPFGCKAIVTNPDPKPGNAAKTDEELRVQSDSLNRMGQTLAKHGFQLRVHHHTPQLVENAREWRHILRDTDATYVHICVDVDWAYEGGFKPVPFLQEVGNRLQEIHVRSAKDKIWLEDLEDSDIDYRKIAQYLRREKLAPLIVVELAYRPATLITRSLQEDLTVSRQYAERIFGVKANA